MPPDADLRDGAAVGTATALPWRRLVERVLRDPSRLSLVLQPIVDLRRGVVVGYEALTRIAPEPSLPPDRWFLMAEAEGLGPALEAAVLRRALSLRPLLPPNCFLSVNVGPTSLVEREVQGALREGSSLRGLVVEITEHRPIDDYGRLAAVLDRLRSAGAAIAVDDAGAGYAGLQAMLALRPEFVKLDRSLVAGLDRDEVKRALVEMVGTLAGRMDAWLLAEGIERPEELDALVHLEVPLGQGYLLARPGPAWPEPDPDVLARVRRRAAAAARPHDLEAMAERMVAVPEDGLDRARQAFLDDDALELVAVLDPWERPVSLLRRAEALAGIAPVTAPLCVKADEPVPELVRRAMARPRPWRLDPLLCCDALGRLHGALPVERLVERLTSEVGPAGGTPQPEEEAP